MASKRDPLPSLKLPIKPKRKGGDSDEPVQGPVDHWNYGKGNMNAWRKRILAQHNELVGQDVRNRGDEQCHYTNQSALSVRHCNHLLKTGAESITDPGFANVCAR